jgi:5'-nucleotidase (lipoprotein e(P4) family)
MPELRTFRSGGLLAALTFAAACAPATSSSPVATAPATVAMTPVVPPTQTASVPPRELHWFRNAAEMRGIYLEVYHAAGEQLDRLAAQNAPQTWAVILDADETVIDNSTFQVELNAANAVYTEDAWKRWVYREAATALPGAVDFTRLAHRLGGRVVIVTNRDSSYCAPTRENLAKDSIEADLVLCRPTASGDKNPRFLSVINGTASPSLPALKVLMWVGDNIQDFPNLTQNLRDRNEIDYSQFGREYFLLPNPMYGSWERVPYR